ncbi:acyltransferase family protein [Nonomuraea sp. NPDC049480]|uniref:acyltransferase family protein n=1 Tax=Nonomuraea sp. NPDC049480 TaxID=3364353 RepID=UPI0037BC150E
MSDSRFTPPVTTPRSPAGPEEEGGPANTGARWPLPEEAFWSERTDPSGVLPGDRPDPRGVPTAPPADPLDLSTAPPADPLDLSTAPPADPRRGAATHSAAPPPPPPETPGALGGTPGGQQGEGGGARVRGVTTAQPAAPVRTPAAHPGTPAPSRTPIAPSGMPGARAAGGNVEGEWAGARVVATGERPLTQPEPKQEAEPPKRKRDPFLDNVKFVLIALVVVGHSLVPTLSADSARALYIFIYTFHMPAFVMISGYLSRNFWNSNAKTNKLVDTFLVPYVIVEVGYAALRYATGQKWSLTIIDPAWLNWYLLALLFWRLSTPVWKRMKYPVPVAIAIYLFAGFSQISGDFSMDRFFGLLPFFVIGLVMQPEHFELLNRRWVKIVAVFTMLGAAAVAIFIGPRAPLDPFYFKESYQDLDLSWYTGLGLRIGLLACGLAMCFAVLALVPRGETWFSDLGTRTLYAYLLHGIPVMIAKEMGWLEFPWLFGPLGVLAISFSAFALAIVLCLPETRAVFKWVLEPRLVWLYRRPSGS